MFLSAVICNNNQYCNTLARGADSKEKPQFIATLFHISILPTSWCQFTSPSLSDKSSALQALSLMKLQSLTMLFILQLTRIVSNVGQLKDK